MPLSWGHDQHRHHLADTRPRPDSGHPRIGPGGQDPAHPRRRGPGSAPRDLRRHLPHRRRSRVRRRHQRRRRPVRHMARTPVNRARCHLAGYRTAIGRDRPRAAPRGTAGPPGRRPRPARPTGRGELHVRATAAGRDVGEPVARGPVDGEAPADPGRRPLGWVSERRARGRGSPCAGSWSALLLFERAVTATRQADWPWSSAYVSRGRRLVGRPPTGRARRRT